MSVIEKFENNRSYTERDINALRKKVVNFIRQETDKWTDFNDSDLGMVLVDVIAGLADYENYYLDKQANECYLDRATEGKNIKSILNTLGYEIPFPKGSVGKVIFAVPGNFNFDAGSNVAGGIIGKINIPLWTQVSAKYNDSEDIVFCTTQIGELNESNKWAAIDVVQGRKIVKECYVTDIKDCKLNLGQASVESGNIVLKDAITDKNKQWIQVKDAFLEYEGGRKYSVHMDTEGNVYILFTYDYIDHLSTLDGGKFTIEYLETKGAKGNVGIMAIDTIVDLLFLNDGESNYIGKGADVYVRNMEATSGGTDVPELYKMIVDCKSTLRMMDRCVTLQDYEDMALTYPGVAEAKACDIQSNSDLVPNVYTVKVFVRGDENSRELTVNNKFNDNYLESLKTYLKNKGVAIVSVIADNVELVPFNVALKLKTDYVADMADLKKQIQDNLNDKLGYGKLRIGGLVTSTMVKDIVLQTSNLIKDVTVEGLENPIICNTIQYPYLNLVLFVEA